MLIGGGVQGSLAWRSGPESNRHTRICSPLHHHSATGPRAICGLSGLAGGVVKGARVILCGGCFTGAEHCLYKPRSGAQYDHARG